MEYFLGKLFSCSLDGTIHVWSPSSNEDECHLLTIKGLENTCVRSPIGVLRNGYHLVTCTYDEDNGIIALWDSTDARLVFKMDSNLGHVVSLRILETDGDDDKTPVNVALGSTRGLVYLINLLEKVHLRTLNLEYANMAALDMISFSNGYLVVFTSPNQFDANNIYLEFRAPNQSVWDPKLYIWNANTGELLQKLKIKGRECSCLASSP